MSTEDEIDAVALRLFLRHRQRALDPASPEIRRAMTDNQKAFCRMLAQWAIEAVDETRAGGRPAEIIHPRQPS